MSSAMSTTATHTYADASTEQVTASNGIEYAYRDLGAGDVPLVLLQHFRGNLDNWDPALVDALAADRRVVTFDNVGVGGTTGRTPDTIEAMAHDAVAFLEAMEFKRVDLLGFSIGSFVAQEIALIRPDLLRRVVLASTAPQGAAGMHGWAPEVINAVGTPETSRRDTSPSSSPRRRRVARQAGKPPDASSGGQTIEMNRRRGRPARRSTTPSARGGFPTTRSSSESRRSMSRCSSPTATATR
jgi:pimeloyl-ACP methyl ester carboxylesterase